MILEALKCGINRAFVGAIFDLCEHIFVARGQLAVSGGVDVFLQLNEHRFNLLRELLIGLAERSVLCGEGDALCGVRHAGGGKERSHRKDLLKLIRFVDCCFLNS